MNEEYEKHSDRRMPAWVSPDGVWITCNYGLTEKLVEMAWILKTGHPRAHPKSPPITDPSWASALKDWYAGATALRFDGYVSVAFSHDNPRTRELVLIRALELTSLQKETLKLNGFGRLDSGWRPGYYPDTWYKSYKWDVSDIQRYFPIEYEFGWKRD